MCCWVYIRTENQLWTVGFYSPDGKFNPESDHDNREEAAKRVAWLNGGGNWSGPLNIIERWQWIAGGMLPEDLWLKIKWGETRQ
jgi:hypothetical protein